MDELRQQVRADAAKAARKNAEVLAEAVGQTAGPAVYIQDYGYNTPRYANVMLMAKSAAVADAAGTAEATAESGVRKNQDRALGHGPLSAELSERT